MNNKLRLASILVLVSTKYSYATVSSGPYVGVELGAANEIINYQASAFNINANGAQLYSPQWTFLGRLNFGYNVSKYYGFELSPSHYFTSNSPYPSGTGSMSTNTTALDFSYIAYLPISQTKLSVLGRVGVAYDWIGNSSSGECGCNQANFQPSGNNFADVLGAGLKYNLGAHTSLRLEWIANGLLFPVSINSGSQNIASWTGQTFEAGINFHF